jgi:hypothetical protein
MRTCICRYNPRTCRQFEKLGVPAADSSLHVQLADRIGWHVHRFEQCEQFVPFSRGDRRIVRCERCRQLDRQLFVFATLLEKPYLRWFFEHFAYDPGAITAADLDVYVDAITQVGALRAGLAVYQDFFRTADQVSALAKTPLEIPVRAYGGEACLGGLTLTSVQAVAPAAEGGVIERCGHWVAEERPDFVTSIVRDLAGS